MRQVIGRSTLDLDAETFAAARARHERVLLDIGTGDGKHVLAVARAQPGTLAVGLDAGPDAMRRTAARAAQQPRKGGLPNVRFVWASVEALPQELAGITDVHVLMPWGSLLRVLTRPDVAVLRGIAAVCAPGARFLVTLNLHAWRPPVPEVGDTAEPTPTSAATRLAEAYAQAGWQLTDAEYLDAAALGALGTSWTKRLGSTRAELAVLALRGTIAPQPASGATS